MILKLLTLFIAILPSMLHADTVDIGLNDEPTNILKNIDIYIDSNNKDFKYIQKNTKQLFKPNKTDILHLGYSKDTVWLKFSIKNSSIKTITKLLEFSNPMLDNIILYTKQKDGNYKKERNGVILNQSTNENILNMYFDVSIEPKQIKDYYIKVSSVSSPLYFKLYLLTKDELYKKEIKHQLILVLFFASIITLIIYNLFIYIFTKNLAYLYYVLYLFFTVLEHLSYTVLNKYIFTETLFKIDLYLSAFYISFISIFAILFVMEFLNLKRYKKNYFVLKIFLILDIFFIIFASQDFYPLDFIVYIGMFLLLYILAISLYLLYKGNENSKYMVIGWSIAIFGWVMLGSYSAGGWSLVYKYPYIFELSIFIEAILFSVALANKLNKTKALEKSIQINKILMKELHHRVKNNMQLIISMYRLKLSKVNNVSKHLKEVEGNIQAICTTHELLYTNSIEDNKDTKTYFSTLVDKLKNSYNRDNIDIKLHIGIDVHFDLLIHLGIILNELITNSYKYAFDSKEGYISISLVKNNNHKTLIIEDNGKGYDYKKTEDSFGLELVKSLIVDELEGSYSICTKNGTKYTINF